LTPTDRELEIVEDLLQKVLVHEEVLTRICDLCAELDCLLSFAQAARTYDFNMPDMCEDNVIKIVKGRRVRKFGFKLPSLTLVQAPPSGTRG